MKTILYLKIEQSVVVEKGCVTIGDVAALECSDQTVVNRLKAEKLFSMDKRKNSRRIVSILYVIEKVHCIYPQLEIQNLGETDFVVSYRPQKQSKMLERSKVAFVCLVSFFGAMFSMMTFNEDVSTRETFGKVYIWVTGMESPGITVLEICYSIGVSVGIVVFFNHFGKKYITDEPSPVEVEMAGYEQEVNDALIKQAGRKGQQCDVDS